MVLIVAVIAAVSGLRTYARYVLQGRLNDARMTLLDQVGPYDPQYGARSIWNHELDTKELSLGVPSAGPILNSADPADAARARLIVESVQDTRFQESTTVTQNGR